MTLLTPKNAKNKKISIKNEHGIVLKIISSVSSLFTLTGMRTAAAEQMYESFRAMTHTVDSSKMFVREFEALWETEKRGNVIILCFKFLTEFIQTCVYSMYELEK